MKQLYLGPVTIIKWFINEVMKYTLAVFETYLT